MPKYRTTFVLKPPRPSLPPAFYETRDAFRAAGLDLWADGPVRYFCRNAGVVLQVFRSIGEAQAWLAAWTAERPGRRAR